MSREALWERVRSAWAKLGARPPEHDVHPDRERESTPPPRGDEPRPFFQKILAQEARTG